jgi:hypothetical protein
MIIFGITGTRFRNSPISLWPLIPMKTATFYAESQTLPRGQQAWVRRFVQAAGFTTADILK